MSRHKVTQTPGTRGVPVRRISSEYSATGQNRIFWGFRIGGDSPRTAGYLELDANCRILSCWGAAYRLGLCCKGVRAARRRYQGAHGDAE